MARSLFRHTPVVAGLCALMSVTLLGAGPAKAVCKIETMAELPVTMVGTKPTIHASINGHDAVFMVDTGAFFSTLTPAAAERFGLRTQPILGLNVVGVGGEVDGRSTTVDTFKLANVPFRHVDFVVVAGTGEDVVGVIGQNLLTGIDEEYDLANGVIRLLKPAGCPGNAVLTYWAKDGANEVDMIRPDSARSRAILAYAAANGQRLRVMFDSGAALSGMTLRAAARAGVTPATPGVVQVGGTSGIGPRIVRTWIAPFDSFALGGEEIRHTRLRIADFELNDHDMLLGADFFLSHRIYVSQDKRKIYFTYNGGPVFRLDEARTQQASVAPPATAAAAAPPPDPNSNAPTDAAGFARRGAADFGRRDFAQALADFSRAIELEPQNPEPYFARARVRLASGERVLAMADLDDGLKLAPDNVEALVERGGLFLASKDLARGKADLDHAAQLKIDDPAWGLRIANLYEAHEMYDEAIAQLDRWIAANPKDELLPQAQNARCWARAMVRRDLDLALKDCDAAVHASPGGAAPLDSRGLVHLDRGELDRAIADYDAALRIQPKLAWSLYGRGLAELKKGLQAQGDADIAAATALAPRQIERAKRLGFAP
jgi:tetratricopeptide (TPR) repeat protein/predicted aspartyl protease